MRDEGIQWIPFQVGRLYSVDIQKEGGELFKPCRHVGVIGSGLP